MAKHNATKMLFAGVDARGTVRQLAEMTGSESIVLTNGRPAAVDKADYERLVYAHASPLAHGLRRAVLSLVSAETAGAA